jgi:hypothetical protein
VNNIKRTFIQEVGIPDELSTSSSLTNPKFWLSAPVERSETIVGRLLSPSGKRTALLRETASTPKKRFVEIWRGDYAELILETTSRHGSFYADGEYLSLLNVLSFFRRLTSPISDILQSVFLAYRGRTTVHGRIECTGRRPQGSISQIPIRCTLWRAVHRPSTSYPFLAAMGPHTKWTRLRRS